MLQTGVLNPHVNSIADRGFPFWAMIETGDSSLGDDVPTVLQVLAAMRGNFVIGKVWMAQVIVATADDLDPAAAPFTAQSGAPRPTGP